MNTPPKPPGPDSGPRVEEIPEGDDRLRLVCPDCGFIHYDNPKVVATAEIFFLVIPLSIGFMGMMQVANASFNARGLPRPALVISILRGVVLGIPLAVLGDFLPGEFSEHCTAVVDD